MRIEESFAKSALAQFLNSPAGRIVRVMVGVGFILWGATLQADRTTGALLIVLGLVPLSAGAFDLCYLSALLGGPITGRRLREEGRRKP